MSHNRNETIFGTNSRKAERMNFADSLSPAIYNLIIGGVLLYGFIVNALMVWLGSEFFISIASEHYIIFIVAYFILCFAGSAISLRAQNPFISFLGYNLVVVPIGALLSICLPAYYISDIFLAIVATGVVTAVMMLLGTAFPRFFAKLGRTLLISLLIGLIANTITLFLGYTPGIFNWFFVILFSLYIGYDWQKAQMYPKTADNAVDSALDLYMDIINLFIRLLRIMSKNRK